MNGVTISRRRRLWREQDGRCWYCDIPMEPPKALKLDAEALIACQCDNCQHGRRAGSCNGMGINVVCIRGQLDHVVPRVFGGTDQLDNLVYACTVCNQMRILRDTFLAAARAEHERGHHPGPTPTDCAFCARAYATTLAGMSERARKAHVRGLLPPLVVARRGIWVAGHHDALARFFPGLLTQPHETGPGEHRIVGRPRTCLPGCPKEASA